MKVYLKLIVLLLLIWGKTVFAQQYPISNFFPEIKVLGSNGPAEGYYFMGSKGLVADDAEHYIAIIDNYGTPVFFRKMEKATSSVALLDDGRIGYLNGIPRKLYILDEMLEVTDTIEVEGFKPNGHDWDVDENGHVLLMGQLTSTMDMRELVVGGDSVAEVLDLVVQEFDDSFELVKTWNSADHFEILDGNENSSYLDFTENQIDYVHANGISIDSDTSFLISCRHMDEITKVDRRTGNVIWRLGGKKNQFQFINDELKFSHQHSIRALKNGNILLFDNGNLRTPQLSSVVEYDIDEANKTATLVKRMYRDSAVYSNHQGATQRIHNGNTLANWGPYWPSFTEFNPDGTTALEWDFTGHSFCPRIEKYKWQTKVFEISSDSIDFGLWENDSLTHSVWLKNNKEDSLVVNTIETRSVFFQIKNTLPILIEGGDSVKIDVWFNPENSETGYFNDVITISSDSETDRIARQVIVTGFKNENIMPSATLISPINVVNVNSRIQIVFSEPMVTVDGISLDNNLIDLFLEFKEFDISGDDLAFNAVISTDKTMVTLMPEKPLNANSNYYVSVKSGLSDYAGNNLDLFQTSISTVLTNSTLDIDHSKEVLVYPNPVQNILNISGLNSTIRRVEVFDINGILVLSEDGESAKSLKTLCFGHLSSGIYFLVISTDNKSITKKIVKF